MADPPQLHLSELKAVSVLGRGARGLVFLVDHCSEVLALKVISRSHLNKNEPHSLDDDRHLRISFEHDVLASLHHPLLPSLRGLVSTDRIVGFAIDHCPGGNLTSLRKRQTDHMFSDDVIRFYAAEMVLALEHLHGLGIVYRDLKPDNVLIQSDGHLMLVDFDLSTRLSTAKPLPSSSPRGRWWRTQSWSSDESWSSSSDSSSWSVSSWPAKSNSFVGTEEYVAPEVIEGTGHDNGVDWWSFGVVLYEMLYGRTPFRGKDRRETFYRIVKKEPSLVGERTALRDLIGRLLEKDPRRRIGVEEIKGHDFFKGVDWDWVVELSRPPFIPVEGEGGGDGGGGIDVEEWVKRVFGWEEEGGCGRGEEGKALEDSSPSDFLVF